MADYAKVVALTTHARFPDLYLQNGNEPIIPEVGQHGFMEVQAAKDAEAAGDVLRVAYNSPVLIDRAVREALAGAPVKAKKSLRHRASSVVKAKVLPVMDAEASVSDPWATEEAPANKNEES